MGNLLQPAMNQKPFPDQICVGSDKLLVWNLSTASPDDISRGNTSLLHHNKFKMTRHNVHVKENHLFTWHNRSDHGSQNYPILHVLSNVSNLVVLSQFGIGGLQFLT